MKYSHVNDLSKDSEPSNIDWQNLALKPWKDSVTLADVGLLSELLISER